MDLITLALAKKMAESGAGSPSDVIPSIGQNGNWYIGNEDTGVRATVPTNLSSFTNDSGYLTIDTLPVYDLTIDALPTYDGTVV